MFILLGHGLQVKVLCWGKAVLGCLGSVMCCFTSSLGPLRGENYDFRFTNKETVGPVNLDDFPKGHSEWQ